MEIIVKKDILDELQAKGLCQKKEDADQLLQLFVMAIADGVAAGKKVIVEGLGSFSADTQTQESISLDSGFAAKVKAVLNIDDSKATKALETLVRFLKDMLLRGYEVQIGEFASLRIEDTTAQVMKSPTGQKTVFPAKKILVFSPEKKFLEKASKSQVLLDPSDDFQKQIGRLKSSAILLVVPQKDFFFKTFEYYFEKNGWKVHTIQTVDDAKQLVSAGGIYLVVLDSQVEHAQALGEMVKCNKPAPIPLIMMYPKGTDLKKPQDFRICGDEYLLQPFEIRQLIALAESVLRGNIEGTNFFRHEVMLQFFTNDQSLDKAKELCGKLFSMSGLDDEGQICMGAAFGEALTNAAQHGNKHRRDKLLEVLYLLDQHKITIAVSDSGPGFPWPKYVNAGEHSDPVNRARQSHKEGKLGGLGIMLMLRCVDNVEYNEFGNLITLTKQIKPTPIND